MDASGTVPAVGVELDDLHDLIAGQGPLLTVHLATEGSVENAGPLSERRWRALRDSLLADGAPAAALERVDPLVARAHERGEALAVIADADHVHLVEHLDEPLVEDRGSWSAVPDLLPLVRWRQENPSFVVTLADRGGADLVAERAGRRPIQLEAGDGEPERKSGPGGWSQPRYQRRAEEDWSQTAREVAEAVVRLDERTGARLVVLGGDVRATQLIHDDLPARVTDHTRLIEHGRAADGSEADREEEIARLVRTAVAEDTVAVLDKHKEEAGQEDRAAVGVQATVDALNRSAVAMLLVADDADDDRRAWVGSSPTPVALEPATDVVSGEPMVEARLVDALVRAAVGTGASIRVVPGAGTITEGVGAILRWAAPNA